MNPQQLAGATSDARITKVAAGAGTGKTKMLMGRIQYLLEDNPDKVVCVAYSTAAAEEMGRRLEDIFHEHHLKLIDNKTCHALGNRIVMTHYKELGFKDRPRLVKDWELVDAYIDSVQSSGYRAPEGNHLKACLALEAFSAATNKPIDFEFMAENAPLLVGNKRKHKRTSKSPTGWTPERVSEVLAKLQIFRRRQNYYLFQDMISMPLTLPEESFRIFNAGHVLVDEVQDLNYAQHQFINRLQKKAYSLTMVGDESQAIFGFQGAQPAIFRNIELMYPKAQVYKLETNYRCNQPILDLANKILEKELDSEIQLKVPDGEPRAGMGVQLFKNQDENIVDWIRGIVDNQPSNPDNEKDYSELAILFRAHRHTPPLEMILTDNNIPYILQGKSFFEEQTVQDLLSYFEIFGTPVFSNKYESAWGKIIKHKKYLGRKTEEEALAAAKHEQLDVLSTWETTFQGRSHPTTCRTANQQKLFRELITDLKEAQALYQKNEWIELARLAYVLSENSWEDRFSSDPWQMKEAQDKASGFMDWISNIQANNKNPLEVLKEHQERNDRLKNTKSKEGVRILTIHGAKGLEWDHVGIWNVGPTTFPLAHGEPQEERRLCYVAVTRARSDLAIFVNPAANKTTVDYLTGEVQLSSWGDHPILRYAGQDALDFMAAVQC